MLVALLTLGVAVPVVAQERAEWSATGPREGRQATDPARLTPEERRHLPVLSMPQNVRADRPFDFVVQVGVDPHVMTDAHHIDWVEISVGERRVLVADLSADVGYPIVRFPLVLRESAELTVRSHCNLHGTWRTQRSVTVR